MYSRNLSRLKPAHLGVPRVKDSSTIHKQCEQVKLKTKEINNMLLYLNQVIHKKQKTKRNIGFIGHEVIDNINIHK